MPVKDAKTQNEVFDPDKYKSTILTSAENDSPDVRTRLFDPIETPFCVKPISMFEPERFLTTISFVTP